jgi:beta-glucosidase
LELKAFSRARIERGETREFDFTLRAADFSYWSPARGDFELVGGDYRLSVGPSSADLRLSADLRVDGDAPFTRDLTRGVEITAFDDYASLDLAEDGSGHSCAQVKDGQSEAWLTFRQCALAPGAYRLRVEAEAAAGQSGGVSLCSGEMDAETLCDIKIAGDGQWAGRVAGREAGREAGFTLDRDTHTLRLRLSGKARVARFWVISQ